MIGNPDPNYYGIEELEEEWGVGSYQMRKWLTEGQLNAHTYIPLTCVYAFNFSAEGIFETLENFQGYVPMQPEHFIRLYRVGELTLREFKSDNTETIFKVPDVSEDVLIHLDDVLIFENNKRNLETSQNLRKPSKTSSLAGSNVRFSPDFRSVEVDGETHYFGDIQARILRSLHEASKTDHPWKSGKQLLHEAGSSSFNLSNTFKRKPVWKDVIESNGKGEYRLL